MTKQQTLERFRKRFGLKDINVSPITLHVHGESFYASKSSSVEDIESFLSSSLDELEKRVREEQLQEIAQNHFDKELGTYDYDGIAEEVLKGSKE